jgi:hypothetical protein
LTRSGFLPTFVSVIDRKNQDFWSKAHFLPTFKNQKWPRRIGSWSGFAGSLPTFPLFFLINRTKKNIYLYIIAKKKWAFGHSDV